MMGLVHIRNRRRRASLVAQMVKNPAAMKETQVQSLGQEDPLEIQYFYRENSMSREAWQATVMGLQLSD